MEAVHLGNRKERAVETQLMAKLHKLADAPPPDRAMAAEDDMTLVAAAQNGSSEAFEILVLRHRAKMLRAALRFTRNKADAEDIAQESLQKAFVHLRRFERKSSFSTWLTRIAINEALMLLRRSHGRRDVSIDDDLTDVEGATSRLEIADSDPDPEASYLQGEEARILSTAMHKLRPGLRQAMELRELAELSIEETARRMGLSVGAVKARLFHGRRKLRETLRRCVRSRRMSENESVAITADARRITEDRLTCTACG
jgi:RNA polymerase sigma-70 factor (ECF subfamily)